MVKRKCKEEARERKTGKEEKKAKDWTGTRRKVGRGRHGRGGWRNSHHFWKEELFKIKKCRWSSYEFSSTGPDPLFRNPTQFGWGFVPCGSLLLRDVSWLWSKTLAGGRTVVPPGCSCRQNVYGGNRQGNGRPFILCPWIYMTCALLTTLKACWHRTDANIQQK